MCVCVCVSTHRYIGTVHIRTLPYKQVKISFPHFWELGGKGFICLICTVFLSLQTSIHVFYDYSYRYSTYCSGPSTLPLSGQKFVEPRPHSFCFFVFASTIRRRRGRGRVQQSNDSTTSLTRGLGIKILVPDLALRELVGVDAAAEEGGELLGLGGGVWGWGWG